MNYKTKIMEILNKLRSMFAQASEELQPKDILYKIQEKMEQNKKVGLEESAFVPNVYSVQLSREDYDGLYPLLSDISEQINHKLIERIRSKGYKMLASSVSLEITPDESLKKKEVRVSSEYVKSEEVEQAVYDDLDSERVISVESIESDSINSKIIEPRGHTVIVEEKKTIIIENPKVHLEIISGNNEGTVIPLKTGDYTLGRGSAADILINDSEDTVSRVHFTITVEGGRVILRDMNSANGTKLNDVDVTESEVNEGDTIEAGRVKLRMVS